MPLWVLLTQKAEQLFGCTKKQRKVRDGVLGLKLPLTYLWTKKWAHWVVMKKASVGTVSGPWGREFWGIEFTFKRAAYAQIYWKASCPGAWVEGEH